MEQSEDQLESSSVERLNAREFLERVLNRMPDLEPELRESLLEAAQDHRGRVDAIRKSVKEWASG